MASTVIPSPSTAEFIAAMVFEAGGHVRPGQGVRALSGGRGLARALPRLLRRTHAAADAEAARPPFWLDPSDPHRMAAVMQVASRPMQYDHTQAFGQFAARPGLAGVDLGESDPSRRRRGHQPRAGGRRGDRPDQADPERVGRQTDLVDPGRAGGRRLPPHKVETGMERLRAGAAARLATVILLTLALPAAAQVAVATGRVDHRGRQSQSAARPMLERRAAPVRRDHLVVPPTRGQIRPIARHPQPGPGPSLSADRRTVAPPRLRSDRA